MAQIPQIPADIYRQVVRDTGLSRKDLCNLCLTSRAVSFEAYPALYANIALHHHKSTVSLIKTIQGSPELGSMIRSFTLRLRAPFADFYRRESQNLARSITLMTGLRNLHLDYPWGARDMTTTSCWTRNISLPSVKSISIETVTYSSVHLLFHQLPSPLPQYISIQRLPTYAIDGVNRLFCRNIYGNWTKLPHLKSLVVWDLPFMPSDISDDVFPALHTFIVLQQLSVHTFAVKSSLEWAPWIRLLKSVKKLGPISYDEISGAFLSDISRLTALEVIILRVRATQFDGLGELEVQRLAQALPGLIQVIITQNERGRPEGPTQIKKWVRLHVEGRYEMDDWEMKILPVQSPWDAFSMLVDNIPPQIQTETSWRVFLM